MAAIVGLPNYRFWPGEQLLLFDPATPLTFQQTVLLSVDAIYENANQALLKVLKEDKRTERKTAAFLKSHELADYFSMWANTGAEGGLIAVGISNTGEAVGCLSIEIEHINRLEKEAHDMCPDAVVRCKRVEILRDKDGKPRAKSSDSSINLSSIDFMFHLKLANDRGAF